MAKEKMLFSVENQLNDSDFQDVFKIYLNAERGKDRKIGLIVSLVLCVVCAVLAITFRNMTFVFYGIGCILIGISYFFMPVNRKFIATNRLQLGENRKTCFYPHTVTSEELFEDDESYEDTEDGATEISTMGMIAYENERGFLFAEGKIVNQFFYIPKRQLDEAQIEELRKFAEERCSNGYQKLQMGSILGEDEDVAGEEDVSLTGAVCSRYYGAEKLRVCDAEGQRIDFDAEYDEEVETDEPAERNDDPTELDVDAELERIISEEDADAKR